MKKYSRYLEANRRRWDESVSLHVASPEYPLRAFRRGALTIHRLEREEVGDVRGKSLLHLQCHFGLDSLSWARLGARVTGVDFSPEAVKRARALAAECGIRAEFVECDVSDLPRRLLPTFDIVYTAKGVLCWLPDVRQWARVVAGLLRPGGMFYLLDDHPAANPFDSRPARSGAKGWFFEFPYFHRARPLRWESGDTYATRGAQMKHRLTFEWQHPVGDVLNALIGAGLHVEFVHEFPFCYWRKFPWMRRGRDGWWRLKRDAGAIPLMWSVRARKNEGQAAASRARPPCRRKSARHNGCP